MKIVSKYSIPFILNGKKEKWPIFFIVMFDESSEKFHCRAYNDKNQTIIETVSNTDMGAFVKAVDEIKSKGTLANFDELNQI